MRQVYATCMLSLQYQEWAPVKQNVHLPLRTYFDYRHMPYAFPSYKADCFPHKFAGSQKNAESIRLKLIKAWKVREDVNSNNAVFEEKLMNKENEPARRSMSLSVTSHEQPTMQPTPQSKRSNTGPYTSCLSKFGKSKEVIVPSQKVISSFSPALCGNPSRRAAEQNHTTNVTVGKISKQ